MATFFGQICPSGHVNYKLVVSVTSQTPSTMLTVVHLVFWLS